MPKKLKNSELVRIRTEEVFCKKSIVNIYSKNFRISKVNI